jgi:hypothetical protein
MLARISKMLGSVSRRDFRQCAFQIFSHPRRVGDRRSELLRRESTGSFEPWSLSLPLSFEL